MSADVPTSEPADPPTEQVDDPEDYNRQQRFKEIHDARQTVREFIEEMSLHDQPGTKYNFGESTRLAYLISLYIAELEPLLIQSSVEEGDLIGDDADHAESLLDFADSLGLNLAGDTQSERVPQPDESIRYFRAANRFWSRVGLDLDMDDGEQNTKFDGDLVDELEEWRQENT